MHSRVVLSLFCLPLSWSRSWSRWEWWERPVGTSTDGTPTGAVWLRPRLCCRQGNLPLFSPRICWISVLVGCGHVSWRKPTAPPQNTAVGIIFIIDSAVKRGCNRCPLSLLFKLAKLRSNHPSVVLTVDVFHLRMLMKLPVTLNHLDIYSYNMLYIS